MQAELIKRSGGKCEICQSTAPLSAILVPDSPDLSLNSYVYLCSICISQLETKANVDYQHLRCLSTSIWSTTSAAQVLSYRLLHQCLSESWAQDTLDIAYLDEDLLAWAKAGMTPEREPTLDVNGVALTAGDSVTIIKDLDVKGANFTAKRGTAVRNIGLSENPLHLEGRVNDQKIVLIAAYTKKQ